MPGGWGRDDDEDLDEGARLDAANAVRQARRVSELVRAALGTPGSFRLTSDLVCELNLICVEGRIETAGRFRTRDLLITGSLHEPPPFQEVPELVEKMCEHVNAGGHDAVHASAYVMWRINWIHPFDEGNGRTARAASYLLLCVLLGKELPGEKTINERLLLRKKRYFQALEAADAAAKAGRMDVSVLETFLTELLKEQLEEHLKGPA